MEVLHEPTVKLNGKKMSQFDTLKPFCCEVMKGPTVENLQELTSAVQNLDCRIDSSLANYLILPLVIHLRVFSKYNDDIKIGIFNCLHVLLGKLEIEEFDLFFELFQRHIICLASKEGTHINEINEDIAEPIVANLAVMMKKNLRVNSEKLFATKMTAVGHAIYILLQTINYYKVKGLKINAMKTIGEIASQCSENEVASKQFYLFIPGIVSQIRTMCSTKKSSYRKVIVLEAIRLLKIAISTGIKHIPKDELTTVDKNLSIVFSDVSFELIVNGEDDLKRELVLFSEELIKEYSEKLIKCHEALSNNLLLLQHDPNEEIRLQTQNVIKSIQIFPPLFEFRTILELIDEYSSSDRSSDSLLTLKKIASTLPMCKLDYVELIQIFPSLVELFNKVLSSKTIEMGELGTPEKLLCASLAKNLTESIKAQHILDEIVPHISNTKEINPGLLFFFNSFLLNHLPTPQLSPKEVNFKNSSFEIELPYFASLYTFIYEAIGKSIDTADQKKLNNNNLNDLYKKSMLVVEGMTTMCEIDPQFVLPIVLYFLIEEAGSTEPPCLSQNGIKCLERLSSRDQKELKEFLQSNMDLILSELNVRFLNISFNVRTPRALIFLSPYFDFREGSFVNLIEQTFAQSCDEFYTSGSYVLFSQIFYAFISSLAHHTPNYDFVPQHENETKKILTLKEKMIIHQKRLCLDILNEEKIDDVEECPQEPFGKLKAEESEEIVEEEEKKLSPELNLVVKICYKVVNFLPVDEKAVRILSMDCLIKGIYLLKDHEDQLLPLIHTIWQNIVPRFNEKDYVIVRKAFDLLMVMIRTSKGFIKQRTMTEVMPKLAEFLRKLGEDGKKVQNKDRVYYTYTQPYKLQMTVLEGIAEICTYFEMKEMDLDKMTDGCLAYLHPRQHKNLTDTAKKLLIQLSKSPYSSAIWIKLIVNGIVKAPIQPNHPDFPPLPPLNNNC